MTALGDVLIEAVRACALAARDTPSSGVARDCAAAARDLAQAHALLPPDALDTDPTGATE